MFIAGTIALFQSPRAGLSFSLHQWNKRMSFVEIGGRKENRKDEKLECGRLYFVRVT
jgi:hypothetical protein